MKLSEKMYERALSVWEEACKKKFVTEMALGTLDEERFRNYMVQDYLYLLDYLDILDACLKATEDPALLSFLGSVIEETKQELSEVHIPNMKKEGIKPDYMQKERSEEGLLAGLTALLQCCWVYAFIGERATERYASEMEASPYKSWFACYTGAEYNAVKQKWIDVLDELTIEIGGEKAETLCGIFVSCAHHENRLWDAFYTVDEPRRPDGKYTYAEE